MLRHLVVIGILPFVVITVVPRWLAHTYGVTFSWPASPAALAAVLAGTLSLVAGAMLAAWSVLLFFLHGDGTLAPWDPPRRFVAMGPYRYTRNPMITGVFLVLCAETLVLRSVVHAAWTGFFVLLNVTFIPWAEEPQLRRRFGAAYDDYCRNVPRFLPRLSPYVTPAACVAVVPASGKSVRFGSDKRQALVDGTPMLERTRGLLTAAGAASVLVIDDNPAPERGMFSTIRLGLERALATDAPVIVVHPADMPFVRPDTVRRVTGACAASGRAVCPRYQGKRGHPLAFPRAVAERLLAVDPSTPLNEAFAAIGLVRVELDVDDPGIHRDVDVPADLLATP